MNKFEAANHERLDLSVLEANLKTRRLGKAPGWDNELWDTIDSTNNRASRLATDNCPEGLIVLSRHQTAGRGRQGRFWLSEPDAGLYLSFLLRPEIALDELPLYTLAAGVASVQAIWECAGLEIGLKWVNDLIAGGKKIGGILAEMPGRASSTGMPALILGIGINLRLEQRQIPPELKNKIDCLENLAGQAVDPNLLVAALAKHLETQLDLLAQNCRQQMLDSWRRHSITLGKYIRAVAGSTEIEGLAQDISQTGGLIVRTKDERLVTLHAGEISLRNADGSYA